MADDMKALVVGLALALAALALPAEAAITIIQKTCGTATTNVLAAAPQNGDMIVGLNLNSTATNPSTLTDSTSASYPLETIAAIATPAGGGVFDGSVYLSPTATFTYNTSGTNCTYDVRGATSLTATYANNSSTSSGTTLAATISTVLAGDLFFCGVWASNSSGLSTASNNGPLTQDQTSASKFYLYHGTATATASTTCTLTLTSGSAALVVLADYTPITFTVGAANGSTIGTGPSAGAVGNGLLGQGGNF